MARPPLKIEESPRKWVKAKRKPYDPDEWTPVTRVIKFLGSENPEAKARREAQARENWKVFQSTASDSASMRYLNHQDALRDLENEKLNRMQIMQLAQRTRAKFLSWTMEERKIFLDVLTADEHGNFTEMFALQAELAAEGITDADLAITRKASKLLEPGKKTKHINDAVPEISRAIRGQKTKKAERAALMAPRAVKALPQATLTLPGQRRLE
jgi:hypothetical protein